MRFDHAYHVVIAEGRCYFGGSVDGKVYALDADTGDELWTFYTEGPVRFAPVVYKDRLFAVSDNGYLYCIAARDGKLLWRLRGGPTDDRVIGNGRIVSRWPARGGPALKDGVVYFACGIWPTEGVYVYAVDAKSGKSLWVNDSSGALEMGQPHQVCFSRSGVAAQGYMVATDESLLVATGRAVPACFDRATGELRHFHLQRYGSKSPGKLGDAEVVATESVFFNTGYVFDLETGKGYSRVMPWRHWGRTSHGHRVRTAVEQFVVTPDVILHSSQTELFGGEISWKEGSVREFNLAEVLRLPCVDNHWSAKLDDEIISLIAAAEKIVVGSPQRVSILDAATRKVLSSHPVDGPPLGLAVADGALFVSTDTGSIYCFRGGQPITPRTVTPSLASSPYGNNKVCAEAAKEIIKKARITEGYCLDLGCGSGALAYELATRTDMRIIAVDTDADAVSAARANLDAAGLYGSRVTVVHADPADTRLPQYFANLVISGRSAMKDVTGFPEEEARRCQRPYGGTICVGTPSSMRTSVRGPLEGAGQWTHHFGSAARTLSSSDRLVQPPFGVVWYKDPTLLTADRHGHGPGPLWYDGILLQAGNDAIRATDAYNGRTMWEAEIPGLAEHYDVNTGTGASVTGGIYCVADGVVYVRHQSRCHLIDVATGEETGRFEAPELPDGDIRDWTYIACVDGILFGGVANQQHVITANHGAGNAGFTIPTEHLLPDCLMLFAMDAETGELKWSYRANKSIRNNAIAIGGGTVYLIDRPAAEVDRLMRWEVRTAQRRGETAGLPRHPPGTLLAMEVQTGRVKWRNNSDIYGTCLALSEEHNVLVMGYQEYAWKVTSEVGGRLSAFGTSDGGKLWGQRIRYYNPPMLIDRELYAYPYKYDLLTGQPQKAVHPVTGREELWEIKGKTFGCGPATGCSSALFNRSGTLAYADLESYQGKLEHYGGIRPGCWVATLPVGGLVLMPDDTSLCNCSYLNRASIALTHYGERPPAIHPDGAIFTDSVAVTIKSFNSRHEIRYTTDGSEPTAQSSLYTSPLLIAQTSIIRAATFSDGSKITTLDARRFVKTPSIPPMPDVHLSDLTAVTVIGGKFHKNRKFFADNGVGIDKQFDGQPLTLAGETFQKGLSALTFSEFVYDLEPSYHRFVAHVGTGVAGGQLAGGQPTYDSIVLSRPAVVTILVDGKLIHQSPRLNPGEPAWYIDIRVPNGAKQISLYATFDQSGGKEHWETTATVVNWANAGFVTSK